MPGLLNLTRTQIASALRGQECLLPDFEAIHHDWPFATNQHLEWLRAEADQWIQWLETQTWLIAKKSKVTRKLKALDMGFYIATAFPDESQDVLRSLLHAQFWSFLWGDEIDSYQGCSGADWERAQKFCRDTLHYIRYALHLTNDTTDLSEDCVITSFSTIAAPLLQCSLQARQDFYDIIEQAIIVFAAGPKRRLNTYLPQLGEYLDVRYHTIGLPTMRVYHGALVGSRMYALPCEEMQELTYHATMLPAIANDILSLRKEIQSGDTDSLVPIFWHESRDIQESINMAYAMMEDSRYSFDRCEQKLLQDYPHNDELQRFLRLCKTQVTGNYVWIMAAKRYGLAQFNVNGQYLVTL